MNPNDKARLHAAVWRNTTRDPSWLGYWLARHQQTEDLDEPELADKLGVPMDNLVMLCLCRTPREGHLFKEDIQAICRKTGASANVLAQLLRQEENHIRFAQAKPGTPGFLAAASDAPVDPSVDPSDDPPTT